MVYKRIKHNKGFISPLDKVFQKTVAFLIQNLNNKEIHAFNSYFKSYCHPSFPVVYLVKDFYNPLMYCNAIESHCGPEYLHTQ